MSLNLYPNFLIISKKDGNELLYESTSSICHLPPNVQAAITEVINIL